MNTMHMLGPLLVLLFPFLGAVLGLFLERRNPRLQALASTTCMGLAFASAWFLVVLPAFGMASKDLDGEVAGLPLADWLTSGKITIQLGFHMDHLGVAMLGMVSLAAFMIHVFSIGYMEGDPRYGAFFRWINFFAFSMLGLVVSDNLLTLYVCWELMGLSSYKLIGFFYHKESAYRAGIKAFMTTRIGDAGMFLGILLLYALTDSFRYEDIFNYIRRGGFQGHETLALLAALGIFFGSMGKSAQFPLHVWLPDAMEGPTPVSALIHAATMVSAGVYLVGRMYPLFEVHPLALPVVGVVGAVTALFAGTIAVCATDIKKVLAYSTCSQLGFMFAGLGAGGLLGWKAGMFHLITHAFFKACLFLGSGSVIHAVHTQEIGQMGGLRKKIPFTFATWMVATLAIAGFPLTAGFFSKDEILLALMVSAEGPYHHLRLAILGALVAGAFLTAAYMWRVTALTFFGEPREKERWEHAHESPILYVPLIVLAVMAVASGYGWHGIFLDTKGLDPKIAEEAHHWHWPITGVATAAGLGGLGLGAFLYTSAAGAALREKLRPRLAPVFRVWKGKYFIDELYWATVVAGAVAVSRFLAWWDREVVDGMVNLVGRSGIRLGDASGWADREVVDAQFVHGAAGLAWGAGGLFSAMQGGRVRLYVFQAVFATAVLALVIAAAYG